MGELQFEVIQYRLMGEYSASVQFQPMPYFKACWIKATSKKLMILSNLNKPILCMIKKVTWFTWQRVSGI